MVGEEASIFELLKNSEDKEARDDGLEGLQEHHVGKLVMKELMGLSLESEVFKAKAAVLHEMNKHHIDEEEHDVFAHVKNLCSTQEIGKLFEKYEQAEEKAKS